MKLRRVKPALISAWNASRWLAAIICAALLSIPPSTAWSQHDDHAGQSGAPVVGNPAIPFELKSLEGNSLSLPKFRGKPLVVNFFASWCDPCREEMPLINDLASKSAKGGYGVLGIAVEDSRAAVTEYVKEAKLDFPIALDLNSTVKRAYRIFGPPATFFIDGQGIVRDVVLGPISGERAREAMKKLGIAR
jgi:cytochrome c biogenesis protein CcmG/thiol:disulfide interchange protein DsbE